MDSDSSAALRFLALGDSYTAGEGVASGDRWPDALAARLRTDGIDLAPPEVVAATGWTTDELDAGIDAAQPRGPFALVTLLIGVNDQYRGRPLDEYRRQFHRLLRRTIAFAEGVPDHVIVVSIPDWSVTPFAADRDRAQIAREVDAFNAAALAETAWAGARWADVTSLSRTQGADTVGDGLHPGAEAYRAWADRIEPAVRAALVR